MHLLSPSQFYPPVPGELLQVGSVEISRESTVEDLKLHILTLPTVSVGLALRSAYSYVYVLSLHLSAYIWYVSLHIEPACSHSIMSSRMYTYIHVLLPVP